PKLIQDSTPSHKFSFRIGVRRSLSPCCDEPRLARLGSETQNENCIMPSAATAQPLVDENVQRGKRGPAGPDAPTVDGAALEQIHGSIRLEFSSEEMRPWTMEILRLSA